MPSIAETYLMSLFLKSIPGKHFKYFSLTNPDLEEDQTSERILLKIDALYDWDQFDPSKRVLSVSLFHNIDFPLWKSFEQIPKYVPPKF